MNKILHIFIFICILTSSSFGAIGQRKSWELGYTFLNFLESKNIPLKLYYNLSPQDQELTAEVNAGVKYYTLSENKVLLQALIPISEDMQIHIYKQNDEYKINFIPIKYFQYDKKISLSVKTSIYQDLLEKSNDIGLVNEYINTYKNNIDFKRSVMEGDRLAITYKRKYRLNNSFGTPEIEASVVETRKNKNYLFMYKNGRYYDIEGKEISGFMLEMPLKYVFITSRFSKGRKHPVLGITRPHYGVDFRAKIGTRVLAAASGRVIFAGKKGGYGKTIEIMHDDGIKTLYAHMSKFDSKIRVGTYVKKTQSIGRTGNTGITSGPHLHFGLYKNNRPINPLGSIRTKKSELKGKQKKEFLESIKPYKNDLDNLLEDIQDQSITKKKSEYFEA